MDLQQLDKSLKTLTKSEILYKSGLKKALPYSSSGKVPIYSIEFATISDNDKIKFLDIAVKKNSRYNPIAVHMHDYVEINYVYCGSCPQRINDKDITLKQGQVLLIDMNTPHSIGNLCEDDIMISILISKKYLQANLFNHLSTNSILSTFFINAMNERTQSHRYILFESDKSRRLPLFFNEFLCEFYAPSVNATDILTNLFGLIIAELINVYENNIKKEQSEVSKTSVIPIMHYIEENFQSCTLEQVAKLFNLNPTYLSSLLKKHVGMNYKQLVQSQKLKYAVKLLKNTDMPVTEIANDIGYENVNFFIENSKIPTDVHLAIFEIIFRRYLHLIPLRIMIHSFI